MQLVIRDNKVIATHTDEQNLLGKYPENCEIVFYSGQFKLDPDKENLDPRTEEEKKQSYKHKRKIEYPPTVELIEALWEKFVEQRPDADKKIEELQVLREKVKTKYPKPS